jgi:hypothetical protein
MVMSRRILKGEEEDESDQTAEVLAELDMKKLPSIDLSLPPPPGLVLPPPIGINTNIPAPIPQPAAAPLVEESANVATEVSRGTPPLPPSGLPDGWSQDQWESFGWQYLDALSD